MLLSVLQGDIKQYDTCNSSSTNGNAQFRGNCIGRSRASDLILNIEEASAKLPGDFGFVEGETSYLTSESIKIQSASYCNWCNCELFRLFEWYRLVQFFSRYHFWWRVSGWSKTNIKDQRCVISLPRSMLMKYRYIRML